jgi:septal ring factor EnvC (AmiA/AmiB activator)
MQRPTIGGSALPVVLAVVAAAAVRALAVAPSPAQPEPNRALRPELQQPVSALQLQLAQDEKTIAQLQAALQQLQTRFANHTHPYTAMITGLDNYGDFLRDPDGPKNVLIPFVDPKNMPNTHFKTGPPQF